MTTSSFFSEILGYGFHPWMPGDRLVISSHGSPFSIYKRPFTLHRKSGLTLAGNVCYLAQAIRILRVTVALDKDIQPEVICTSREEIRRYRRSPRRDDRAPKHQDKFTTQKIKDLNARIDIINTEANAPVIVDTLIRQTKPPFTERMIY
ncbi:hypothetical protein Acr_26g0005170 [Actinidia rufa]|uniref:Uncharacterized protein n=1 Tax=Actinidia rufa TaxID=165716 RepID=A0A7J0H2C6_9ERIC|nr:hypothetical protein Acr_26g0005170 [Actinidia rufa]